MTDVEVEKEIGLARSKEGEFPLEWIVSMNEKGIWFEFRKNGVRWSRYPFY